MVANFPSLEAQLPEMLNGIFELLKKGYINPISNLIQ